MKKLMNDIGLSQSLFSILCRYIWSFALNDPISSIVFQIVLRIVESGGWLKKYSFNFSMNSIGILFIISLCWSILGLTSFLNLSLRLLWSNAGLQNKNWNLVFWLVVFVKITTYSTSRELAPNKLIQGKNRGPILAHIDPFGYTCLRCTIPDHVRLLNLRHLRWQWRVTLVYHPTLWFQGIWLWSSRKSLLQKIWCDLPVKGTRIDFSISFSSRTNFASSCVGDLSEFT